MCIYIYIYVYRYVYTLRSYYYTIFQGMGFGVRRVSGGLGIQGSGAF